MKLHLHHLTLSLLLCAGCAYSNATPASSPMRASLAHPQGEQRPAPPCAAPRPSPALVSLAREVAAFRAEVDAGRVRIDPHAQTQEPK